MLGIWKKNNGLLVCLIKEEYLQIIAEKYKNPNGKLCKGHEHVITMERVNIYKRNKNGFKFLKIKGTKIKRNVTDRMFVSLKTYRLKSWL